MAQSFSKVILANRLATFTAATAPSVFAGYDTHDLWDGTLGRGYRAGSDASPVEIDVQPGAGAKTVCAIFGASGIDAVARSRVACTLIEIQWANIYPAGPWTSLGTVVPNTTTGDALLEFADPGATYYRWIFTLASAKQLKVEEIVLGTWTTISRQFTEMQASKDWGTVVNRTLGGNRDATKLRSPIRRLVLPWDALSASEWAEIEAISETTLGGEKSIVLLNDSNDLTDFRLGYVQDVIEHREDDPLVTGVSLVFEEAVRPYGVR